MFKYLNIFIVCYIIYLLQVFAKIFEIWKSVNLFQNILK